MSHRREFLRLSPDSIPAALAKAAQLRSLHESYVAESICRDVLRVEPENQEALVRLILTLTDQFREGRSSIEQARKFISGLHSEYEQHYYTGVIYERWARSIHQTGSPDMVQKEWYEEAMRCFEKADSMRPPANEEARLRWNSCLRSIRAADPHTASFRILTKSDEDMGR